MQTELFGEEHGRHGTGAEFLLDLVALNLLPRFAGIKLLAEAAHLPIRQQAVLDEQIRERAITILLADLYAALLEFVLGHKAGGDDDFAQHRVEAASRGSCLGRRATAEFLRSIGAARQLLLGLRGRRLRIGQCRDVVVIQWIDWCRWASHGGARPKALWKSKMGSMIVVAFGDQSKLPPIPQ